MTTTGWLPAPAGELFGPDATAEESYGVLTVDVPPASWLASLESARDALGCTYFDWLSAVDEPGTGFRVSAHVVALAPVRRLLVRTTVPHSAPVLPSAVEVYAGAAWHERETHEMFGVTFEGHPGLEPLLLPEGFEGHPLRKDFVLAARVAKAWPGAKEPGESEHGGPKRRQMLPPGVPDPNEWGPLKGQLPPAPARPARGAGRAAGAAGRAGAAAAGDRPARRTRTAGDGSASQTATPAPAPSAPSAKQPAPGSGVSEPASGPAASEPASPNAQSATATPVAEPTTPGPPPRRARSAGGGSASQRRQPQDTAAGPAGPTSPADAPAPAEPAPSAAPTTPPEAKTPPETGDTTESGGPAETGGPIETGSPDAPWHRARPAFDEPEPQKNTRPRTPQPTTAPPPEETPAAEETPEPRNAPEPDSAEDSATPQSPPGGPQ